MRAADYSLKPSQPLQLSPKPRTTDVDSPGSQRKLRNSSPKREEPILSRTKLLDTSPGIVTTPLKGQPPVSPPTTPRKHMHTERRLHEAHRPVQKEGCNCRRTTCLKMHCLCFSKGQLCSKNCSCDDCQNLQDNMRRSEAINQVITKDPQAFSRGSNPIELLSSEEGCKCQHSKCIMKYCKCFSQGKICNSQCMCQGCKNTKEKLRQKSNQHPNSSLQAKKLPRKKPKPEEKA